MPVAILNNGTFNAAFADGTNTGFQNEPSYPGGASDIAGAALTNGSAVTVNSNTTYSYYKNLGQENTFFYGALGSTLSPVTNVTFTGCCWEAAGTNSVCAVPACTGTMTFRYCTFRPAGLTSTAGLTQANGYQYGVVADGTQGAPGTYNSFCAGSLRFENCDFWGFANATKINGSTVSAPLTYDTCWVHDARPNTNTLDHTDGLGSPAGGTAAYVTINKCTVESIGDTQGLAFQNTPGPSSWDHFTVTNNLFGGWGNTICIIGGTAGSPNGGTNIVFTGNTFSTRLTCQLTPLYSALMAPSAGGNLWRNNRWHVPAGAAWGNPAHDGYYWIPDGSNIIGTDDTPFVSLTDYAG